MTLTEFLIARIDEDEAVALAAWIDDGLIHAAANVDKAARGRAADAAHITRHKPARVLAECEAKRQVIESAWLDLERIEGEWGSCRDRDQCEAVNDFPDSIRALAAVYAEHPDYDESWKP